MLSQMFEQFYAHIRNEQYLQFLENSIHFKFNYIPVIKGKKLDYEMQEYFTHNDMVSFCHRILIDIVSIPRTYVYEIDENGKYNLKKLDSFDLAVQQIREKNYQEIKFLPKLEKK